MGSLFGKDKGVDATGRFDRVAVLLPDGTTREMTGAEFDKLAFDQRIKIILTGKPRFWFSGKELTVREAIKRG